MRATEKRTKAGPAAGSLLLLIGFFWAVCSPAAAQSKPIQICKRSPVGYRAAAIKSPQDAADALRRKVNFTPWWIYRNTLSIIFTPLKFAGLRGWTDYCSEACAVGLVEHGVSGIDGMHTADLALWEFSVNGELTRLDGQRFIRVEFFPSVKKKTPRLPRKGDPAQICGKLMWDGDGFLEIHPRTAADVQFLGGGQTTAADPPQRFPTRPN